MATYHSKFTSASRRVGNMAILPLRSKVRGPAPQDPNLEEDIIDEALMYFKPLTFFRNYEFKTDADRVLVYLVLYILECLKKLQRCSTKSQGSKELTTLALARFDIPGDPGFPRELNNLYAKPSLADANLMREYISQLRTELGLRLLDKVYADDQSQPSKWWLCFAKRKFLDQSLSAPGSY
ncbi:arp2:3 complex 21 kda subunit [Echinococcus multilocularis]|uniref:Actin-related protein 2/3 complex subunit 3 n=1 Tax=Echinococcus multilocularis TaxID=6211 RepID=A0A068XY23_ECHMU|nr:arp2:3 complex 21 kda subunit [Echinococcus multilocularis]